MCPAGRVIKGHGLSSGNGDVRRASKATCTQTERGATTARSSAA
jgi:hypothetical protein